MPKVYKVSIAGALAAHNVTKEKEVLRFGIDFSPERFLTRCIATGQALHLLVQPIDHGLDMEPLSIHGQLKKCTLQLEDVDVPDERLADLRFLLNEATDLLVTIEAPHMQEEFPAMAGGEADDKNGRGD